MVWHAQGSFDPEAGSGEAKLRMEPVVFAKDGLQPAQLAPQLAGFFKSATGTLEATGRAQYAAGKPRLALELAARDLALETPNAQFEGVNGTLRLDGTEPLLDAAGPAALDRADPLRPRPHQRSGRRRSCARTAWS